MFSAAASANWRSVSNLFGILLAKYKPLQDGGATNRLAPEVWYPMQEVGAFCEMLTFVEPKFIRLFAGEIFKTVPAGSVFFGGTDPGRFMITALSTSHREGKPFFTITQNQLVARDYLEYLQAMYGQQLKLPGTNTVRQCLDEYLAEAGRRLKHDQDFPDEPKQIRAGEEVKTLDGRVVVSGQIAVMAVNGLVAKAIVNGNPAREFHLEESFPLEWMYPHLTPAGPIFKLNHELLDTLSAGCVLNDRDYWMGLTWHLIGFKVQDETTVAEVCDLSQEFAGKPRRFARDPAFLRDQSTRNTFAKLRSSIAGLYTWRASHAKSSAERRRMIQEAELAFKQACLLSPKNPESVWRFTMFLVVVLVPGKLEVDAHQVLRIKPGINPQQSDDAFNHQTRAREQDQREIRHVGANDEQDEPDGPEQPEERSLQIIALVGELRARRAHPKAQPARPATPFPGIEPVRRVIPGQTLCDRVEHDGVRHRFALLVDRHRFVLGKGASPHRRHVPEREEIRRNDVTLLAGGPRYLAGLRLLLDLLEQPIHRFVH